MNRLVFHQGKTYTFRINNLLKPDSLYNSGMQPVVYSKVREARDCVGWLRGGSHTRYYKNSVRVPFAKNERYFSTLTWKHVCDEDSDTVYFAHCYPYTYTDLQTYLTHMSQDRVRSAICRQRELCRTLAGNMCDLLTITEYGCSSEEMKLRKGIIVTARVHPGESNASWMMKGFLDFITSDHPDARMLRRCFIFKVVPMLNPDGVIAGNYRTSLAGVDLNRVYNKSNRELYPTINALKLAMKRLQQDRAVLLYVDLHGHSRKQNVFMYGCNNAQRPAFMQRERVFPKMLSLNGPSYFHYKECRFNVKANKESTGRVNTWRELGLLNAFTLEATFCGSTLGELRHSQFNCRDFERMGEILCDTILDYCDPNSAKKAKILLEIRATPTMNTDGGDDDSSAEGSPGSDSSDSNGETELAEIRFKSHALKNVGGLSFAGEAAIVALTSPPPPELSAASRGKTKAKLKSKKDRDSLRAAADKQTVLSSPSSKFKDEAMSDEPSGTQDGKSKKLRGSRSFVSKFNGRGGSGIPSFTEEQAAERRRLKLLRQEAPGGGGSGATLGGCSSVVGSPSLGSPGMADDSGELGFDGGSGGGGGGNGRQGVSRARSNNTIIARYLAAVNTENCGSGGGRVSDGGGRATADPSPRRPERPVQDLQFLPTKSLDLDLPRPTGYRTVRNGNGSATSISNSSPPHHSVFVTAQPDLVQATLELLRQRVHDERRRSIGSPSSPEDWHRIKQRMQTSRQRISVTSPPTSPRQVPSTQFDLDTGLAASSETTAGGVPPTQTASFKPRPRRTSRTSIESDIDVGIEYLEERAKQRKQRQSLVSGIRDFELANLDTLDTVVIDPPPSDRPVPSRPGSGLEARRRGNGVSNRSRPWTATAGGRRTSWTNMSEPIASGSSLRAVHELRKSRSGGSATTTRPVCEQ
jgi:murein tripeptide amidase MpaA